MNSDSIFKCSKPLYVYNDRELLRFELYLNLRCILASVVFREASRDVNNKGRDIPHGDVVLRSLSSSSS